MKTQKLSKALAAFLAVLMLFSLGTTVFADEAPVLSSETSTVETTTDDGTPAPAGTPAPETSEPETSEPESSETPEASASPESSATPEATPAATPEATPAATPEATAMPESSAEPTAETSASPDPAANDGLTTLADEPDTGDSEHEFTVSGTTIDIPANSSATAIQDAINFIAEGSADKTSWTINVGSGTYNRFTVLDGMDNLTVQAVGDATIGAMDNSEPPVGAGGGYPDTAGISIRDAQDVTISGFTIVTGTQTGWLKAAISNYTESTARGDGFTVKGCIFTGNGTGTAVFVNAGTTRFNVQNCNFQPVEKPGLPI